MRAKRHGALLHPMRHLLSDTSQMAVEHSDVLEQQISPLLPRVCSSAD